MTPSEVALTWTNAQERLLVEWSDDALCQHWLHTKAEERNRWWHFALTVPIILLSTLTGTANFGMSSIFEASQQRNAQLVIGSLSLTAAFMGTLSNFLQVAQLMESHRQAALAWGKYHRTISIELSLRKDQRSHCQDFIKFCRSELDRLIEQSPSVPQSILDLFHATFKSVVDVHKPDICNGLEPTRVCNDEVPRVKERVFVYKSNTDSSCSNQSLQTSVRGMPTKSSPTTSPRMVQANLARISVPFSLNID